MILSNIIISENNGIKEESNDDSQEESEEELDFDNLNDETQEDIVSLVKKMNLQPEVNEIDLTSLSTDLGSLYDSIQSDIPNKIRFQNNMRFNSGCNRQMNCCCCCNNKNIQLNLNDLSSLLFN